VVAVALSVVFAAASATAPKPAGTYKFDRSRSFKAGADDTWTALIDTFADNDWAIGRLEKDSGIITTDWMLLSTGQADEFADCGSTPGSTNRSQVRFNVRVRGAADGSVVVVNTTFRRLRTVMNASDVIDCTSKGVVEALVHEGVSRRVKRADPAKADKSGRKTVSGSNPLFCAVTAPEVGICYQDEPACAASLTEGAAPCDRKVAGSCFTATKVLDESKSTTCAVSIKDCEARRTAVAADPDYKVTPCGIYRAKAEQK